MSILRIDVNNREILRAGGDEFCSLSWCIVGSLIEDTHAHLDVSGLKLRNDDKYDSAWWLESYALNATDRVFIECAQGIATTLPVRRESQEENEALRQEVLRAESAGEYEAIRAAPKVRLRDRVELRLEMSNEVQSAASSDSVDTVVCSGIWSNHHRPEEWNVRIWEVGSHKKSPGHWLPIKGGIVVEVAA